MKLHPFTKLSLGLGEATLVALGFSPQAQAVELKIGFNSSLSTNIGFKGGFVWNSSVSGVSAVSQWNWNVIDRTNPPKEKIYSLIFNKIQNVSFDGDNLSIQFSTHWPYQIPVEGKIPAQFRFSFSGVGDAMTDGTPTVPSPYDPYSLNTGLAEMLLPPTSSPWKEWDDLTWSAEQIPESVPEPTTIGASLLALGFLGFRKFSKSKQKRIRSEFD